MVEKGINMDADKISKSITKTFKRCYKNVKSFKGVRLSFVELRDILFYIQALEQHAGLRDNGEKK